jgi:hypothetical protein
MQDMSENEVEENKKQQIKNQNKFLTIEEIKNIRSKY